ncbi:thiamine pyrophosphate-dependent enzyme [Mesorhizobium onobrychidis]|uniref:Alpha-keto acid decarboxylase family protein n=1 Tax=Mesorhizobium onobrychidis TaxID=2775404 RepID=A0ABY5R963_9HYPH|nr:thiamine pyrophosphate-dependent enzyme [Mesorhizobium onobrychidis]UVC19346.1 hypothetical protein IHQ72_36215 [Mesorhizobium onobrychidis]
MPTAADYIIERMAQHNVEALFGVPAVYCAPMFAAAARARGFRTIVTASDLEAGYAADAYARVRGLSVVSVAYGVGTLSLINAVAGAYIERSPMVVINGGPTDANIQIQTEKGILFSHSMGRPHSDLEAFRPFTAFCERPARQTDVPSLVDRALVVALTRKHPVYLEIPQDWLGGSCPRPSGTLDLSIPHGAEQAIAATIVGQIKAARKPLLMVGIEVQRFGLASSVMSIIRKLDLNWATTLLARSTLPEPARPSDDPRFLGVFNGNHAPKPLRDAITQSDLLLSLGAVFGSGHARLMLVAHPRTIRVWDGLVHIPMQTPQPASIDHLVAELDRQALTLPLAAQALNSREVEVDTGDSEVFSAIDERAWDGDRGSDIGPLENTEDRDVPRAPIANALTYDELFAEIGAKTFLDRSFTVIPDTFLGIYSAAKLKMPSQNCFISSAIWASIGHSVGAGVGAAIPGEKRPLVVCGDGGFQMIPQALSTMARYGLNAVIVIVDNGLYGYEQYLLAPGYYSGSSQPLPYTVLSRWQYESLARSMGVGMVASADTVASLKKALAAAKANVNGPAIVHAIVGSRSLPAGL